MRSFVEDFPFGSNRASLAPPFSDYAEDVVLAAATVTRVAIPPGARFVIFAFDGDFRARQGIVTSNITLPSATTSDGSGAELNPSSRRITDKLRDGTTTPTHICLIAPAACKGSLAFYG